MNVSNASRSNTRLDSDPDIDRICKGTLKIIPDVQNFIKRLLVENPSKALLRSTFNVAGKPKTVLRADLDAEDLFEFLLPKRVGKRIAKKIRVIGEESLLDPSMNLSNEEKIVALVDMLDGSDLYARGFSNWCSAITFFHPIERRILATFVGKSTGDIYFATESGSQPRKIVPEKGLCEIKGPSSVTKLKDAVICFYGQQADHFLSVTGQKRFISFLKRQKGKKLDFRIYNLGGNPMMTSVADGIVDAVLGLQGQAPHDFAPGAFIAHQAKAVFLDPSGTEINLLDLLLMPARQDVKYVIASTRGLFENIMHYFPQV